MRLVFRGKPTQSRAELFDGYSRQFRRAVDAVFAADETPELADRLRANVSRFAAYKSVYVEGEFAKIAANQEYDAATRKAAMRAAEDRFARWTDAEYNTATARCRTAKQFSEFLEPDNRRLFPNLQWLATRSATPRADHAAFAGKIWPKTDPFWNSHAPGTEWNCKCDIAETDEPATDNSDVPNIEPPRGLEGNPAETGEVFTDKVGYIRNAPSTFWETFKPTVREVIRQQNAGFNKTFDTNIGKILVDEITIEEVSKGSATSDSYFLKQEIARNIDKYIDKLQRLPDEPVDLGHNNHKGKFYKRKLDFSAFRAYELKIETTNYKGDKVIYEYTLKMGVFSNGTGYNLYAVNG